MNMVEKVARALCAEDGSNPDMMCDMFDGTEAIAWSQYASAARAAIEAMREPTARMIKASLDSCPLAPYGMDSREVDNFIVEEEYRAMIDAALEEDK